MLVLVKRVFNLLYFKRFIFKIFYLLNHDIEGHCNFVSLFKIVFAFRYSSVIRVNCFLDIFIIDFVNSFKVTYYFFSTVFNIPIFLSLYLDMYYLQKDVSYYLVSLCLFFRSALWIEREVWDMFGIFFLIM